VRIWFTQELTLRGNELRVLDADGNQVDNGDARLDQGDPNRKQVVVSVPTLGPGTYTVSYTASSSDDGHTASDSYQFTIEAALSHDDGAS
jgi:methionine-rich copper-binding protein CopC